MALCMQPLCHEIHPQKTESENENVNLSPKESVERTAVFFGWLVVLFIYLFLCLQNVIVF